MPFLELPPESVITVPMAGYVADATSIWRARTFRVPTYQWVLIVGNGIRLQRGHHRLQTVGGDFLLLRPNEVHGGWGEPNDDSGFYWVRFWAAPAPREVAQPALFTHPSLGNEPLAVPYWGRLLEPDALISQAALTVEEWERRRPYYHLRVRALLTEMLVAVARHGVPHEHEGVAVRPDAPGKADIVLRVLTFLGERYTERVAAHELERELGHTYAYVCRLFRQATGMTMRTYVHRLRVSKARDLLVDYGRHYSIREAGEAVGYDDPAYFSRVFREVTGASPRRFIARAYTS